MVATETDEPGSQWLWADALFGFMGVASCHVDKLPAGCAEVKVPHSENTSRYIGSPTSLDDLSPMPEPEVDVIAPEGAFSDRTPRVFLEESQAAPAATAELPDLNVKVYATPPQGTGCISDSALRSGQCCQKLCPSVSCAVPLPSMLYSEEQTQRRTSMGARFCVLLPDAAGLLAAQDGQEDSSSSSTRSSSAAFREAFAEAVAEAGRVSRSRVKVLDVGPPFEAWWAARREADSDAPGTPSTSSASHATADMATADTGAGVLRFLEDDQASEASATDDSAQLAEAEMAKKESTHGLVRVLAIIKDPAELSEHSGSTAASLESPEEPGALRALEMVLQEVKDSESKLQRTLAVWAGGEPVSACRSDEFDKQGRIRQLRFPGRHEGRRKGRGNRALRSSAPGSVAPVSGQAEPVCEAD